LVHFYVFYTMLKLIICQTKIDIRIALFVAKKKEYFKTVRKLEHL